MPGPGVTAQLADLAVVARLECTAAEAMRRGLRHLARGPAGAQEALSAFEIALVCREYPAPYVSARARCAMAGTWINIATARLWLDRPGDAEAAAAACTSALALMAHLPDAGEPGRVRRRAIAHHTRGRALLNLAGCGAEARAAFTAAIEALRGISTRAASDRDYLLAAAWVALADALARERAARGAIAAAGQALHLVRRFESHDERAAEVGLVARHVYCRAVADALDAGGGDWTQPGDVVHGATDAADDGLALARRWERRGITRFQSLAQDLYRFGAGVYGRYQPQFLAEFVRDFGDDVAVAQATRS